MADIDIKDTPYVALALSFYNDGIWSEDKGFSSKTRSGYGGLKRS